MMARLKSSDFIIQFNSARTGVGVELGPVVVTVHAAVAAPAVPAVQPPTRASQSSQVTPTGFPGFDPDQDGTSDDSGN